MARLHPPADRVEIGAVVAEIAKDAVFGHLSQRLLDRLGGGEVHVRDPHRQFRSSGLTP
jgi:hypothetical protein